MFCVCFACVGAHKILPDPDLPSEAELRALMRDSLAQAAFYERRAEGFRVMLEARRMILGDDAAEAARESAVAVEKKLGERPTMPAAILRIMAGGPPTAAWTPAEMHSRLVANDWGPQNAKHPVQTVGATMSRMHANGQLARDSKGEYRLPSLTTGGT